MNAPSRSNLALEMAPFERTNFPAAVKSALNCRAVKSVKSNLHMSWSSSGSTVMFLTEVEINSNFSK